jgi:hypothetical protein
MKLTTRFLKRLIEREMKKSLDLEIDVNEIDPSDLADSLENKIDYVKALKIEESRLLKRLRKISETKKRIAESITKSI